MDDRRLIQIVDAALAEAARNSGPWLACRPGCTQCCHGPFPISAIDVQRLLEGLAQLDPTRSALIRERAQLEQGDDDPCPVLDPATGLCELYAHRPLTCRTFGPAFLQNENVVGVCELCYTGASDEQIAACAVPLDIESLDNSPEETTIAQALRW
jgi:Fe-S-cluster containining protein